MADEASIALARVFCAERAAAEGKPHTAECYRSGAWDEQGEMLLATAMIEWMAKRDAPSVWPSQDSSVRSCTARAVVGLAFTSWAAGMAPKDDALADMVNEHRDRIVSVALQGLGIDPDARAS